MWRRTHAFPSDRAHTGVETNDDDGLLHTHSFATMRTPITHLTDTCDTHTQHQHAVCCHSPLPTGQ